MPKKLILFVQEGDPDGAVLSFKGGGYGDQITFIFHILLHFCSVFAVINSILTKVRLMKHRSHHIFLLFLPFLTVNYFSSPLPEFYLHCILILMHFFFEHISLQTPFPDWLVILLFELVGNVEQKLSILGFLWIEGLVAVLGQRK